LYLAKELRQQDYGNSSGASMRQNQRHGGNNCPGLPIWSRI
jgi:hypothetical protein